MHARWCVDHARWFRYRNCIWYCTFSIHFTRQYQYHFVFGFVSVLDRSLLRLTNRTDSCYELQMIDIVPWYSTLLQYCNTGSRSSSFDDRKFLDMTINLYHITQKFPPDIWFTLDCRLDELINVASDFNIIFDRVVKFNKAIKTVLFDEKKIEYQNGSLNDNNWCPTNVRCAFRTVIV
jgi:hypothetical protein